MSRLNRPLLALALAVGAVLGLSACGGSSGTLLPGTTAKQINANLDQVRTYVAEGDCLSAEDAVSTVIDEVDDLGGVDAKLKAALKEGTTRLSEVVANCESEEEGEEKTEPAIAPAVETQELEADEKKEEKRLEKQAQADEKTGGGPAGQKGESDQGEAATPPPPANGKGEEGGGPAAPPAESSPSGGIGPGVQAGEG